MGGDLLSLTENWSACDFFTVAPKSKSRKSNGSLKSLKMRYGRSLRGLQDTRGRAAEPGLKGVNDSPKVACGIVPLVLYLTWIRITQHFDSSKGSSFSPQ